MQPSQGGGGDGDGLPQDVFFAWHSGVVIVLSPMQATSDLIAWLIPLQ
jgi:hypothetical protein